MSCWIFMYSSMQLAWMKIENVQRETAGLIIPEVAWGLGWYLVCSERKNHFHGLIWHEKTLTTRNWLIRSLIAYYGNLIFFDHTKWWLSERCIKVNSRWTRRIFNLVPACLSTCRGGYVMLMLLCRGDFFSPLHSGCGLLGVRQASSFAAASEWCRTSAELCVVGCKIIARV